MPPFLMHDTAIIQKKGKKVNMNEKIANLFFIFFKEKNIYFIQRIKGKANENIFGIRLPKPKPTCLLRRKHNKKAPES